MHIKKLEISGFKSFVDRSVVHFDHDVIGIVGPNGCGKSNIVDAIRWCMGEQSAKHLRGRAMEDVIFNGSESRAPAGMAEVTLTFDNSDKTESEALPPEYRAYADIAVTRRLYRDGTSEYLINKTQVRLRDVTDLFLGTGVGTKAYSIVEQGRIGQIISSRPVDRRTIIEEAAGITKYKQRRKQADRKMELTQQNLFRLNDIVSEIERNRTALKRQASKAERFISYRRELEDLYLHDASHRYLEMIVTGRVFRTQLEQSIELIQSKRELSHHTEEQQLQLSEQLRGLETDSETAQREALELDSQVKVLQSERVRLEERLASLKQSLKSADLETESLLNSLSRNEEEKLHLENRLAELLALETSQNEDTSAEQDALEELRRGSEAADLGVKIAREAISENRAERAALEANRAASERRHKEAQLRLEALEQVISTLKSESEDTKQQIEKLNTDLSEAKEQKLKNTTEKASIEAQIAILKPELLEARQGLDAARKELGIKHNRLKALEELLRRYEGIGAGTKQLLTNQDPSIVGLVADHLKVPAELTDAIGAFMGDRLQAVIVKDPEKALSLLEDLKDKKSGRVALALSHSNDGSKAYKRNHVVPSELNDLAGYRGYLVEHLSYADSDSEWVAQLFHGVLLVETGAQAIQAAQLSQGATIVALDGTVVGSDGLLRGGSGDDLNSLRLEQKREIGSLQEQLLVLEHHVVEAEERLALVESQKHSSDEVIQDLNRQAHSIELLIATTSKELNAAESVNSKLDARLNREAEILATLQADLAKEDGESGGESARLEELEGDLLTIQGHLNSAEQEYQEWTQRIIAQQAKVTERRLRLSQAQEQVEATRYGIEKIERAIIEATQRHDFLQNRKAEEIQLIGQIGGQAFRAAEQRAEAAILSEEAKASHLQLRHQLEELRLQSQSFEQQMRLLRVELSNIEEQSRSYEMKLQKLEIESEHLTADVAQRYRGIELPRIIGDYHARSIPDTEHRQRQEELTRAIDRMGPVNLDAQAEYEEAEKRFEELGGQRDDLVKALEDLDRAIKHMDRESKRRFREAFTHINELFKVSFTKMFNGGRAELRLTDPDDMLESGVEIMAMPPGKKLGNIELMSGGEKALTAVSLIFAIFEHKPSPFCILDEVDAPLDEANVTRYNDAIRRMTDRSQFILITHIKKTMQSVDVLYGVTMAEPGVSRLVSVKVNDQAESRSSRTAELEAAPKQAAPAELTASA